MAHESCRSEAAASAKDAEAAAGAKDAKAAAGAKDAKDAKARGDLLLLEPRLGSLGLVALAHRVRARHLRLGRLGFGHIVVSEMEAPNM